MRRVLPVFTLIAASVLATSAQTFPPNCVVTPTPDSQYLICPIPGNPTAPLVLYAHGYVAPNEPLGLPLDQLAIDGPDGPIPLPLLVNSLGYAFAAASYPKNGLAIQQGMADTRNLLSFYKLNVGLPSKTYITGVSEGSLIATKLLEQYPADYAGGFALCGPIGDFRAQVNHIGDFRAVFDYFYPNLMPGSAVNITAPAPKTWAEYEVDIVAASQALPNLLAQAYKVEGVPVDSTNFAASAVRLLWYSFHATNDANTTLGGNPFDNKLRLYLGSSNDFALNVKIKRHAADRAALDEIAAKYRTTGKLAKPLVTMHTTGDPVVPYAQSALYGVKVLLKGSLGNYLHVPILRYGHCSFKPAEVIFGFAIMVLKSGGTITLDESLFDSDQRQAITREIERAQSAVR